MSTNGTQQTYVPCTLQTCPLSDGIITYQPNVGANAFFSALFGLMLLVQLGFGIRYKTWTFLVAMVFGLALEVVGYVGRVQLHDDPFSFNYFIEYLVCLTIAPAFLNAAIYITFRRVVHACDDSLSWIRPNITSIIFITSDFLCLVLQAAGGAITSTSGGASDAAEAMRQTGINIMIGGLVLQVVSLFLFMAYAAAYAWRWHVASSLSGRRKSDGAGCRGQTWKWRTLVTGLAVATITIFIRCVFRVAELQKGFQSPLASNEVAFMILEAAMVLIACLALTIGHPGPCLSMAWKVPKRPDGRRLESGSDSNVALGSVHV